MINRVKISAKERERDLLMNWNHVDRIIDVPDIATRALLNESFLLERRSHRLPIVKENELGARVGRMTLGKI